MTQENAALSPYLDVFPEWLRTLGDDAVALAAIVSDERGGPEEVRAFAASGLNYIFKSLDLIPDGIDDLGYCDDAFVLRVAASLACEADSSVSDGVLARLGEQSKAVADFLGDDYARLVEYVKGLRRSTARGRAVDDILTDASVRSSFVHEVTAWAAQYQTPSFSRDAKTLIKLKAFLSAKLS